MADANSNASALELIMNLIVNVTQYGYGIMHAAEQGVCVHFRRRAGGSQFIK
jgi:hypothetical protein